jgi:tetratricopeptide (TPR) repeat protein
MAIAELALPQGAELPDPGAPRAPGTSPELEDDMRVRSGLILTLAAGLLGGCAAATSSTGGTTAPAGATAGGKSYPPGTRPSESKFTTTAKLNIAQGKFNEALQLAQQGIAADTVNPQHYFLAGQAYAGLGDYAAADSMYRIAERKYPAYEREIEPSREEAWAKAFNAGVEAYNAQKVDEAIKNWEQANLIYAGRPTAFQNLAALYTQQGKYEPAIAAYRAGLASLETKPQTRELTPEEVTEREESKVSMTENLAELLQFTEQYAESEKLFREQLAADSTNVGLQAKLAAAIAAQPNREAEAQAIYSKLIGRTDLKPEDVMSVGVALFNSKDYANAAKAFQRLTVARPNSRDAWYNYANALYASDQFQPLVAAGERLLQLDPLNEDAALILARSYKETGANDKALATLEKNDALPVKAKDLAMRIGAGKVTVNGTLVGNRAAAGTPVTLRFSFQDAAGTTLGTQEVTVNAPAKDATAPFTLTFENATAPVGYSYELVR